MRALPIARITARLGAFIRAPARRTHSRKRRIPLAPAGGNVYDGAMTTPFEIFLAAPPGLEPVLAEEAAEAGFPAPRVLEGGVAFDGGWEEVMRANLVLRGATRVLARIGAFRALHLAQLDKRARRFPWGEVLRTDMPVRVDVTSRRSRIYHAGAARERIETALRESAGIPVAAPRDKESEDPPEDAIALKIRIEDDLVTISVDTSGPSLHKRGHKEAVNKAPLRETLAALFLRQCGYTGAEPVVDPMCGSGTFVIEAAEIAAGLLPGRSRRFAFEDLACFDPVRWAALKETAAPRVPAVTFHGSDRDEGAIRMSTANAARAGVTDWTRFTRLPVSEARPPEGTPGLVMVNPPYGARLGNPKLLAGLYGALGQTLKQHFTGWRVGLITSEERLSRTTGLRFLPPGPPVPHGSLRIRLYRTDPL